MDKEREQIIGDLVFVELNIVTALTIARHLNISTDEANQILKQYHDQYSKSLQAVYTVSGQMIRSGITCGAHLLAKEEEVAEAKKQFTKVDSVDLFAIHKDPIQDIGNVFSYDALEDERFFRGDGERAPIKAIQVRKLCEEIQASNQEAGQRPRSACSRAPAPVEPQVKHEIKMEDTKKQDKEKDRLKTMFQKACEREKVTKDSPKKVRESPFSSPEKSSPLKKRARKILIDSEDEETPKKKGKVETKEEIADEPTVTAATSKIEKEKPKKTTPKSSMNAHNDDDDLYEAASPEKSPPVKDVPKEKKLEKKVKKPKNVGNSGNINSVLRRSPRKLASIDGKKKIMKKSYETFVDDDGFLVTKEVFKEVEVDEDENAAPERFPSSNKSHESSLPDPKSKKPVPKSQAKISSFFTKK